MKGLILRPETNINSEPNKSKKVDLDIHLLVKNSILALRYLVLCLNVVNSILVHK